MVTALQRDSGIRPSFADSWKRIFLGKPLTSEQLESERLSNPVALGAISPDAISSTAYGPEQVMVELLPRAGMAAFALLLPIIGVDPVHPVVGLRVLPRGRDGLHPDRRGVHGGAGQLRASDSADRRRGVADRLCGHRRGAARGRDRGARARRYLRCAPTTWKSPSACWSLICIANLRGLRQSGRIFAITTYSFVGDDHC